MVNPLEQTAEELEARLTKGADLLWEDERKGLAGSDQYEHRLAHFKNLLAALEKVSNKEVAA